MPEQEQNDNLIYLNGIKSASGENPIAELYPNTQEQTYYKSPYVSDTYLEPYNPDDIYQKTWDYSTYEKMTNDDQINVCLRLKKDLVLGSGGNVHPQDSGQEELAKELNEALTKHYQGNFTDDLEEILTAYEFGFSLTEKVFTAEEEGELYLKSLKTRHPNSWLIHQDERGNVSAFEQRTKAGSIWLDKNSIMHYINDKRFQNPYGTSDLRSAYNAWITKTHITRFFGIFLEKAASPIPVGRYDKNAPSSAVDKLFEILKRFQTKTAITIPKDVEIEFLEAKNNGDVYAKAIHLFNMFIGRALFIPDLLGFTGSETGGGSLALGKEQMGLFFKHIKRRQSALEDLINKEILKPIIEYNYGFLDNPPQFKFDPLDDMMAVELAKVWLEAIKGNAYKANPEEINYFRSLVKFPEGDVIQNQQPSPLMPQQEMQPGQMPEMEEPEVKEEKKDEEKPSQEIEIESEEKKEFAKAYDLPQGDYHKKVDFKKMKTKLDDYDNSVMNEASVIVKKMLNDLFDQIEKKKIIQTQNTEKIDTLSLKYKKELKQVLKSSFMALYDDAQSQAATEINKSEFKKPLAEDKFLEVIDDEAFKFVGDYEYTITKKTRQELIAAIKDGRPLSSVITVLSDDLQKLSETQIERFARTKHTEVMNNARKEYFDSTGAVTGYQYSAILDDRTSDICSGLHGKFFKASDAPTPPMHFNCRSTLIPITKYEEFKPTEKIRGMTPDEFIEENKGEGFAKYSSDYIKPKKEIKVGDPGVEFETEYPDPVTELYKYSYNGRVFQETTIIYKTEEKKQGEYKSIKHKRVNNEDTSL